MQSAMNAECLERVINVGFIGLGGFVRGNHLPNVAKNPHFKIVGMCDLNEDILHSVGREYDPCFSTMDFKELCSDSSIDLVIIGTGPSFRIAPIREACENGKSIYVEKPMSLGWEDSREIIEIVRKNNSRLMVGFNRPYSKIMRETKRIFKKIQNDGPALFNYRIVSEDMLWPQFHRDLLAGSESTIVHELTHIFDLFNWLLEKDPKRLYTIGGKSDNNIITIEYPGQNYVSIVSGGCGTEGYPKERLEIFTGNKVVVMDEFLELQATQVPSERGITLFARKGCNGSKPEFVSSSKHLEDLQNWRKELTPQQIAKGYYYDSRPLVDKGHYDAIEFMYNLIVNDQPAETNEYRGAVATIMGLEAIKSLSLDRPVDLDFSGLQLPN